MDETQEDVKQAIEADADQFLKAHGFTDQSDLLVRQVIRLAYISAGNAFYTVGVSHGRLLQHLRVMDAFKPPGGNKGEP